MAKPGKAKNDSSATKGKKSKNSKQDETGPVIDQKARAKQGRAVVADGASWTGKLPATLLHEYCQKQKWEKVIYDMIHNKDGYVGVVNISWKNPKTGELISIKMIPEKSVVKPQETSIEARHFAATYALHRIAFGKNLHMTLPPNHRSVWSDLEIFRKRLVNEFPSEAKDLYSSDPFSDILEKRKEDERKLKELKSQKAAEQKVEKPAISISLKVPLHDVRVAKPVLTQKIKKYQNVSFPRKVWNAAPFVDLKPESRELITKAIKAHVGWGITHKSHLGTENSDYKEFMTSLGFRASHVEEAMTYTNTFTETLEWLIFHLPEDDLPPSFAKSSKDSNISLQITGDLKKEYMTKRLTDAGFDKSDVLKTLSETNFDECMAAVALTYTLVDYETPLLNNPDSQSIWDEEMESMEVIYGDRFKLFSREICEIKLNPHNLEPGVLTLRVFKSLAYPDTLPGLQLKVTESSYKLANYIKLSIIKKLALFVIEGSHFGLSFVFNCVEWLEEEIYKVIENPGPLYNEPRSERASQVSLKASAQPKASKYRKSKDLSTEDIKELQKYYEKYYKSADIKSSLRQRSSLPAWKKRQDIVNLINDNKVTLITGETGSGKSTQAVQFMLDDLISKSDFKSAIICSQPRRISTIGLAERVSEERCTKCGEETGYIIRGENKTGPKTRISFVTTGVLLRMIQGLLSNKGTDSYFNGVRYIFIDEVHERSIDSDFLLIILKKILVGYPNLKIVLMSATTDVSLYRNYFDSDFAHIHIEGRTFPIKDYYLDEILDEVNFTIKVNNFRGEEEEFVKPKPDSRFFNDGNINNDLIAKVVNSVHARLVKESNDGSLLIFLPGVQEINSCIKAIYKHFDGESLLLPLHSALSANEQKKVFKIPRKGVRKIVVATNVAETSITIPDAVCVIDTGRSKSIYYDPSMSTTKLQEGWCSQAEVGQRRGRAGRITNGICYKLYTRETQNSMLKQPIPEIKRIRLENVYLVVKSIGVDDVKGFLNSGLDPPDNSTLQKSHDFLADIGAIVDGELTHLGSYLSMIPTDFQSGKLLIFGTIFGCLETCLTLAAIASSGSPFISSHENRDSIKKVQQGFAQSQGDLIAIVNAFDAYEKVKSTGANKWLNDNYLSYLKLKEMRSIRTQYVSILQDLGFIPLDYSKSSYSHLNRNSSNWTIVKSIITGAFYPQIARVQLPDAKYASTFSGSVALESDAKDTKLWTKNDKYDPQKSVPDDELPATRAFLHPSSSLFVGNTNQALLEDVQVYDMTTTAKSQKTESLKSSFAVFYSSLHTTRFYLRDVTPSSTLAVLLFGGEFTYDLSALMSSSEHSPGIVLDGWIPIRTWCKNGVLIKQLRMLLDTVIAEKLASPSYEKSTGGDDVLQTVEQILDSDAKD